MSPFLARHSRLIFGLVVLAAMLSVYFTIHPRGFSLRVVESLSNAGASLALAAIAQVFPVLTGGLDLSIGGIIALCNTIASWVLFGSPLQIALGIVLVLATGLLCGLFNGLLVVVGRMQPVIATLATGAVFTGLALIVRPRPGGEVSTALADPFLGSVWVVPTSFLLVVALSLAVWYPLRRSSLGRGMIAAGSAAEAGRLSGLSIDRSVIAAYVFSGLFGAFAALFLSFQTLSGDATIGVPYTINSIAAIVVGGITLRGGAGNPASAILGAYTLRAIGSILLFSGAPPLAQPFFEGLILVAAVTFASMGLLRNPNRLDVLR